MVFFAGSWVHSRWYVGCQSQSFAVAFFLGFYDVADRNAQSVARHETRCTKKAGCSGPRGQEMGTVDDVETGLQQLHRDMY